MGSRNVPAVLALALACGPLSGCVTVHLLQGEGPAEAYLVDFRLGELPGHLEWRTRIGKHHPSSGTLALDATHPGCQSIELVAIQLVRHQTARESAPIARDRWLETNRQTLMNHRAREKLVADLGVDACQVLAVYAIPHEAYRDERNILLLGSRGEVLQRESTAADVSRPAWVWPLLPLAVAFDTATLPFQLLFGELSYQIVASVL